MTSSSTPTAYAVSPDSGEHWTAEGAWQVAEGIHRIPLPLPMDGLKAINVYVITTDDGLVLIDGGWSIEIARDLLDRCLRRSVPGSETSVGSWSPTSIATTTRWPGCWAASSGSTSPWGEARSGDATRSTTWSP